MVKEIAAFFKKKQKPCGRLSRTSPAAQPKSQKFFGSFFQKRTASQTPGAAIPNAAQAAPQRPTAGAVTRLTPCVCGVFARVLPIRHCYALVILS
jgi:hypothetical protein